MAPDTPRGTILIVDDEAPLLRLISRVLEREGYDTLTAADGDEAKQRLDAHAADLHAVILDVFIPPNGVDEVVDHLTKLCPDVPTIFASGDMPEPQLAERIEQLGASFLRKPFQPRALIDLVARAGDAAAVATVREG